MTTTTIAFNVNFIHNTHPKGGRWL